MAGEQWFTYEQLQNAETLEAVLKTPGAKVIRQMVPFTFVASVGQVGDLAVYAGEYDATATDVYAHGQKTSRELGEMVFPELAKCLEWRY